MVKAISNLVCMLFQHIRNKFLFPFRVVRL